MIVNDSIKIERIPGDCRFVRFLAPWSFYSEVVKDWCDGPKGFVYDEESVPLIKGSNHEAGAGHDLACRSDFETREKHIRPTKWQAAKIYLEIQEHFDALERLKWKYVKWHKWAGDQVNRGWDWTRRYVKTGVVIAAPGYFHKFRVLSSYEEISGK